MWLVGAYVVVAPAHSGCNHADLAAPNTSYVDSSHSCLTPEQIGRDF